MIGRSSSSKDTDLEEFEVVNKDTAGTAESSPTSWFGRSSTASTSAGETDKAISSSDLTEEVANEVSNNSNNGWFWSSKVEEPTPEPPKEETKGWFSSWTKTDEPPPPPEPEPTSWFPYIFSSPPPSPPPKPEPTTVAGKLKQKLSEAYEDSELKNKVEFFNTIIEFERLLFPIINPIFNTNINLIQDILESKKTMSKT